MPFEQTVKAVEERAKARAERKQKRQEFQQGIEFQGFSTGSPGATQEGDEYLVRGEEDALRVELLESSWMINNITLLDVDRESGSAYTLGERKLYTGRSIEGRFRRRLAATGTPYELVETDSCVTLPYADMAALANTADKEGFEATVRAFFRQAMALDMLRVGLNGKYVGWPTDPDANPLGEDINKGWQTLAQEFNSGSQVLSDAIEFGAGGDFESLDTLATHLIQTRIPRHMREDPRLVVMVGAELAAKERLRLFNGAEDAANTLAAQSTLDRVAGRFSFVPPFMPGKRLVVTTLPNLHCYTQAGTRKLREGFVMENREYESSYLRMEGYALQDVSLYASVDENALTLI